MQLHLLYKFGGNEQNKRHHFIVSLEKSKVKKRANAAWHTKQDKQRNFTEIVNISRKEYARRPIDADFLIQ